MVVGTIEQKYRIKGNRSLLTKPIAPLSALAPASSDIGRERIEILCECANPHCNTILVVLRSDYGRLRPERRQLAVAAGHEVDFTPVCITLKTDGYEFVEPWRP